MTIVHVDEAACLREATVVCLGLFDGVHIGHAKLIERAKEIAGQRMLWVCAHTFSPMPSRVLQPESDIRELTSFTEKAALLESLGVDILAVSHFTEAMMRMRAKAFFYEILVEKLHGKHLVAGFHHRFGYHGEGDTEWLRAACGEAGIGLSIVRPVTLPGGELVSSTAIRKYLDAGDFEKAEQMLGRPIMR